MHTLVRLPWIPSLGAEFFLAADGYSALLVILTVLLTALASMASPGRPASFHVALWLTSLFASCSFLAMDLLLFFVFWEMTLIPMYFVIALWGGERRQYAAIKFLIYTNLGSVLMLVGIIALFRHAGTFNYFLLLERPVSETAATWIFWAFFAGCGVKVPMVPFHTWLPDAHTEAPTAGSVVLAGVLLKMGTYGLLRFALPLAPPSGVTLQAVVALSVIAIIYGALVSLTQKDWKRLIAYSSVSHMGFCTLAMFAMNKTAITGSMLQQLNHGITTGLLFFLVGAAYERTGTREIARYGGAARVAPVFTTVFLIAALGSMGMPPLNGFIGELTIIRGVLAVSVWWAVACIAGVVLGAAYLIWLFQRISFGEIRLNLPDLTPRERIAFYPLAALTILMGVWPQPLFQLLEPAAEVIVRMAAR